MPNEFNGVRQHQDAFFRCYWDALLRRAVKLCRGTDIDPEDLVQDTMERALAYFDFTQDVLADGGEGRCTAWLAVTMKNRFLDRIRRKMAEKKLLMMAPDVSEDEPSIWIAVTDEQFRRAIDQLSPRQRQVIILRLEGWSYKEIAAELGIAVDTVGVVVSKAKEQLRKLLLPLFGQEPPEGGDEPSGPSGSSRKQSSKDRGAAGGPDSSKERADGKDL